MTKTYKYRTDGESGTVEAESMAEAMAEVLSDTGVEDCVDDGAWAWVEDTETGEREYFARENMP
jgi:uncharacterized membrane protein